MSKYEMYKPNISNRKNTEGISYRKATLNDAKELATIMTEREGGHFDDYLEKIKSELRDIETVEDFALFAAVKDNKVIGFGRVAKNDPEKLSPPYPSPAGWYLLGMIIHKDLRRLGIGRGLSQARFNWLKNKDVYEVYSIVSSENQTSIDLHKSLGFKIIQEGAGFLKVKFDCGKGYLFCKEF